jgi:uncharacterized protein DUF6455
MSPSSRLKSTNAPNIINMMERLGIDVGCCVVPWFNLIFCCALRNCGSCTARDACAEWLAKDRHDLFAPPKFCPNFDLLSELLCDPAVGHYAHCVR